MRAVMHVHPTVFVERPRPTMVRREAFKSNRIATCVWIEVDLWARVKTEARRRKQTAADLVNASLRGLIGTLAELEGQWINEP